MSNREHIIGVSVNDTAAETRMVTLNVPKEAQNLDQVKIGSTFKVRYVEAVAVAIQRGGKASASRFAPQRFVHQVHRGRPAERGLLERRKLGLGERAPVHLGEQPLDFLASETQVARVKLEHLSTRAQPLETALNVHRRGL